jgi:uncharacterized protein YejL (UPF0352 family)
MTVDTLRYAEELQGAGVSPQQAKVHAQALNRAVQDGVATKADLLAVEERLGGRLNAVEERLSGRIGAMDGRLAAQLSALETRLVKHISAQLLTVVALGAGISGVIVTAAIAVMQIWTGR